MLLVCEAAARCLQTDGAQRGRQATKTIDRRARVVVDGCAITPWGTTGCHSPGLYGVMEG